MKDRIEIQRFTETGRDTLNQPIKGWSRLTMSWAQVFYGTGGEQRSAAQTDATQVASFEVPATAKTRLVSVGDRILFAGGTWDIRSNAPNGRAGVKINAIRQVP